MYKKAKELKRGDVIIHRPTCLTSDIFDIEWFEDRNGAKNVRLMCDSHILILEEEEIVECQ